MTVDFRSESERIEEAIARYSSMVYRVSLSYTGNRYDAEDVMQDVFCRYVEKGSRFESQEHEKAWLIRVTVNRAKSLMSGAARKHNTLLDEAESVADTENAFDAVESPVMNAVMKLKPVQRLCIHLFYFEDLSIADISRRTGIMESTVKSHLSRARKALGEILQRDIR